MAGDFLRIKWEDMYWKFVSQHLAQGQPLVSGSSYYGNWIRPISGSWTLARGPTFIQAGQGSGKPQQGLVGGSLGMQVYWSHLTTDSWLISTQEGRNKDSATKIEFWGQKKMRKKKKTEGLRGEEILWQGLGIAGQEFMRLGIKTDFIVFHQLFSLLLWFGSWAIPRTCRCWLEELACWDIPGQASDSSRGYIV